MGEAMMEVDRCTSSGMTDVAGGRQNRRAMLAGATLAVAALLSPSQAMADEGGVSFWVPGFFGSLAAAPQQPGFSFTTILYNTNVSAGADVVFARDVTRGNIKVNFNGNLTANLSADVPLAIAIPQYVFATPILGGQAAVALLVTYGRNQVSVDATVTAALGPLGFTRGAGTTDTVTGFGDMIPQFSLRWNAGVNNYMVYVTGDIPVGTYNPTELANIGIGHGAADGGVGYTYLDPQTGHEFSAVAGVTYNFMNDFTQYQNGVDFHLDWGASQFLSKQLMVGLVGYIYDQLSCDSGSGDRVGCFESRVLGVGPQIGYIIPMGDYQGYINLKGYKEFDSAHRPDGWNVWLTFNISPAEHAPPAKPMYTK
jgi:hypothetical protein